MCIQVPHTAVRCLCFKFNIDVAYKELWSLHITGEYRQGSMRSWQLHVFNLIAVTTLVFSYDVVACAATGEKSVDPRTPGA
jgi:hypothetical protein